MGEANETNPKGGPAGSDADGVIIRDLIDSEEFTAGDGCRLKELIHGDKDPFELDYSLARAVVAPGQATALHRLRESSELYYIMAGEGVMHVDGAEDRVKPGQAVYIPPGSSQFIENTGVTDLVFLCIVQPSWRVEDEEVFES